MDLEKGSRHKYIVTSMGPSGDVTESCAKAGACVKSAMQIAAFVILLVFVAVFSWYLHMERQQGSSEPTSSTVLKQSNVSTPVYSTDNEEPTTFTEPEVTTLQTDVISELWPLTFGGNIDLNTHHPKGYREGQASDSHSCDDIRSVPEELRSQSVIYKYGIPEFYQKYTEAYGIPVLGSLNVTDAGLRRACYILRLLLASRYDIRNAMYKFYIRVVLIGDDEQTTSLWEYRDWNSEYWDARTRGVGPSLLIPLVSAGDDNQRCRTGSRYSYMDVLLHELSHGVHHFGARYIIPGFEPRLKTLYDNAMSAQMYKNSYAATNRNEYWPNNTCITYHCNNVTNLGSRDVEGDIYIAVDKPGIGELESSMELHQLCTKPANMTDRCNVATDDRIQCGPVVQTTEECQARGCCYLQGQCVYAQTSACVDRLLTCHRSAIDQLCETNTDQMTSQCPSSCNLGVCHRQEA